MLVNRSSKGDNIQHHPSDVSTVPAVVLTSLEERREKCPWCWERNRSGVPYPEEWSSTLCLECDATLLAQIAQVKAARAARKQRGGTCFS